MDQLQITATFPNIPSDKLAEFKKLAADLMAVTATEPGTLQYDWFFDTDETMCVVRETYASSEAVLAHVANVGDLLGAIVEAAGGLELEAFGNPSDEVRQVGEPFNLRVYSFFQGK